MNRAGLRHAASVLAPPLCGVCGRGCEPISAICSGCERALELAPGGATVLAGVGPVHFAAPHGGAARRLTAALKFGGRTALAEVAAEAIVAALPAGFECRALVPVPAAGPRLRRRGFDPAALIAAGLAGRLDASLSACLVRLDSARQVGRPRAERLAAPPRISARVAPPAAPFLVDDVLTTGATLRACAAAVRGHGREPGGALVFARTLGDVAAAA